MKNRLQWLYDEYMSEKHSEDMETMDHQHYMKNLAMEMAAVEYLMTTPIAKHMKASHVGSKLDMALTEGKWKWVFYLLVEDEVRGTAKYIKLCELAKSAGYDAWAMKFKELAEMEGSHASTLAAMYDNVPYTHGTAEEHVKWDKEYVDLIAMHRANIKKLQDM